MNCQYESASVLGVESTLLEEEMMVSEFQRFTELVQFAACLLIAPKSMKLLSSVLTVSPSVPVTQSRDCLLGLLFVRSQFQHWFSVNV